MSRSCQGVPLRSAARGLASMGEEYHEEVICIHVFTDVVGFGMEEISGHPAPPGPSMRGRKGDQRSQCKSRSWPASRPTPCDRGIVWPFASSHLAEDTRG
eukprot:2767770-Pyramimonas_sp.AAC.1